MSQRKPASWAFDFAPGMQVKGHMKLLTIATAIEMHEPNDLTLDEFRSLAQEIVDHNDVGVINTHIVATEGHVGSRHTYILAVSMLVKHDGMTHTEIRDAFAEALFNLAFNSRSILQTHLAVNEAAL